MAEKKQVPNPVVHALIAWLSHSSTWSLIAGVVLAFVTVFAPTWAGREDLQTACNQLALLLAGIFSVLAAAQKFADAKTDGKTSAFVRHAELSDRAESDRTEARDREAETPPAPDEDADDGESEDPPG